MFFNTFLALCEKKNISPTRVALDIGLSKAAVTRWKQTESTPKGDVLCKLADYFGCSVDYLLGRENTSDTTVLPAKLQELVDTASSLSEEQLSDLLRYVRFIKADGEK